MSGEVPQGAASKGQPPADNQAATTADNQAATTATDKHILSQAVDDAFCVVAVTPYGNPRRRLFLSLHHATQAVKRTRERDLPAELVLCKLVPIMADLEIDGEVAR